MHLVEVALSRGTIGSKGLVFRVQKLAALILVLKHNIHVHPVLAK